MANKPQPQCSLGKGYSFFKVLIGDFEEKLHIPPAFPDKLNASFPTNCILTTYAGRSWHIGVDRVENRFIFQDGWRLFVEDNSLQFGEVLVFYYNGHSQFHVEIYGKSGCEKGYTQVGDHCSESISHGDGRVQKKGEHSMNRACIDHCQCFNRKQGKKLLAYFSKKGKQILVEQMSSAESCPFRLVHPHFARPWRGARYCVPIPLLFVKACDLFSKKHVVLHDHAMQKWKVRVFKKGENRIFLGSPWCRFGKFNQLREGDVFALEFIKGQGRGVRTKIQVHVFRNGKQVI